MLDNYTILVFLLASKMGCQARHFKFPLEPRKFKPASNVLLRISPWTIIWQEFSRIEESDFENEQEEWGIYRGSAFASNIELDSTQLPLPKAYERTRVTFLRFLGRSLILLNLILRVQSGLEQFRLLFSFFSEFLGVRTLNFRLISL